MFVGGDGFFLGDDFYNFWFVYWEVFVVVVGWVFVLGVRVFLMVVCSCVCLLLLLWY